MNLQLPVYVENAFKAYGAHKVLNNFSMHVSKGIIYGLLGASGCGKTTLLRCLVGGGKLDSGQISVLGINPDADEVPIKRIGYMPQEVAIAPEFTVREAVYYFGRIFGIDETTIEGRFKILCDLLDLPSDKKLIRNSSGGEQRRVSFAIALINNPSLLILDEPTVGLDPILRESLWHYLLKLVKEQNVSVIITTHYIEEARSAHKVGFMREGQLLAEESPEKLLTYYGANTLEDVFLKLSKKQLIRLNYFETIADKSRTKTKKPRRARGLRKLFLNVNRLRALFGKNIIQFSRNKRLEDSCCNRPRWHGDVLFTSF